MNKEAYGELYKSLYTPDITGDQLRENFQTAQIIIKLADFMKGKSPTAAAPAPLELVRANIGDDHRRLSQRADMLMERAENPKTSDKERARAVDELEQLQPKLDKFFRAKRELQ